MHKRATQSCLRAKLLIWSTVQRYKRDSKKNKVPHTREPNKFEPSSNAVLEVEISINYQPLESRHTHFLISSVQL